MAKIKQIKTNIILNSRAEPTLETTVVLTDGSIGIASCPSGASVGSYEAAEIKNSTNQIFKEESLLKAIDNIEKIIAPRLTQTDASKQQEIDKTMIELDGTQNKSRLGANTILSVSMAIVKAAAKNSLLPTFLYLRQFINKEKAPLKIPTPLFNLINGGLHAGNNLDFQEFLLIPASSYQYDQSLEIGVNVYRSLKETLKKRNFLTLVGDEGGFSPRLTTNRDAFTLINEAITETDYKLGFNIFLGLDAAANTFYHDKNYSIRDKSTLYSSNDLISYYQEINKDYKLLYLEDPLFEDDWEAWAKLSSLISQNTIIVGDDLTATNPYRLQMALDKKTITGIIIKPNQIGTVIETLAVVEVARAAGLKIIVSHRSGETNDDFLADFAVAVSADYVKFGAPVRGERVAKYNRLLEIERQIKRISS